MCLHDTIDFPLAFLGRAVRGRGAGLREHAADRRRLRVHARALARAGALRVRRPAARAGAGDGPRAAHEVRHVIVSRPAGDAPAGCEDFSRLARATRARDGSPRRPAPDAIAFWLYSSGSTGRPKGTVHTHANLYWTEETYGRARARSRAKRDVVFSAAKLFFAYGLGNALTFPLSAGATVVLMAERPTPAAVFKRLVTRKPTVFFGVPTLYAAMLASPELPARADVALRLLRVGRRAAAEGDRRALRRALRMRRARRHRLDRDAAHLPVQPAGRRALRHDRHAGARLRHRAARRGRAAGRRRRDRRPLRPRAERGAHVLGERAKRRARRSRASGRAAATSTCATPTAATPTRDAATTC